MREIVKQIFPEWSRQFEGRVTHMYLDTKGLVTVAVGNLIDPVQQAVRLPFRREDGTIALMSEIQSEWTLVKSHTELAKQGHTAAAKLTKLHLDESAIDSLVRARLLQNWEYMRKTYWPNCEEWPACAQLGVSSMAWAVGAGFPKIFKTFRRFAAEKNWEGCAGECKINAPGDKSVARRNEATKQLFLTADIQETDQYDSLLPDGEHLPEVPNA